MSDETYTPETLRALADGDDQMVWLTELGVPPPVVETMRRAMRAHADAWKAELEAVKAREEAEEADAKRYRIIRDGRDGDIMKQPAYRPEECGIWGGEELDEWCDRMMTEWAASEPPGTAEGKEDR